MEKYKRLTKKKGWHDNIDLKDEYGYKYIYQRLADLENKIENGTLVDTTNFWYEKEEDKDRYKIYKLFPIQMVFDFADSKAEAEKKIKELKGKV